MPSMSPSLLVLVARRRVGSALAVRMLSTTAPPPVTAAAPRRLTALPMTADASAAAAAVQYDLETQLPAYLHLPPTVLSTLRRSFAHSSQSPEVDASSTGSGSTPFRIKLYPTHPIHAPLLQVAREIGAADAAVLTTELLVASSSSSDASETAEQQQQVRTVRWCRSTPTLDIVHEGLRSKGRTVELLVTDGPGGATATVPVALPSLEERSLHLKQELMDLEPRFAAMDAQKSALDAKGARSASALVYGGLGVLCAQWGLMFRLTYYDFSWDVMEPISYFLTFGTGILSYMWYVATRREYSYEVHTDLHVTVRQQRLYDTANLSIDEYIAVRDRITAVRAKIAAVEAEYADPQWLVAPTADKPKRELVARPTLSWQQQQ